jgi:hypothetical protein
MSVPGWHPDWYRGGESILSVGLKLAYGNSATAREALEGLVSATPTSRLPTMFPSSEIAVRACKLLDLRFEAAKGLFAGIGVPGAPERDHLCLALRWCPTCMAQRYHSWLFQDWARTHCIWHTDALLDRCPRCHVVIDPFSMKGWQCPYCRQPFAEPLGLEWIDALRRPVDAERHSQDALDWRLGLDIVSTGNKVAVLLRDRQAREEIDWTAPQWNEAAWLRWHAWEQCSAVVDGVFPEHSDCVAREWIAGRTEFAITSYACPLGAAVRQTLAWLGCQHERVGGWPTSEMHAGDDYGVFAWPIMYAPRWLTPVLGREVIKEWLSDAIEKFSAAAGTPLGHFAWRPPRRLALVWRVDGDHAEIALGEGATKLLDNIAAGARTCLAGSSSGTPGINGT